ncbi:uncharacterized protein [Aristolochia californica]|uniref:uncharacterized protein isoform X2 n=1 Tax=Aristolochia californica TaxID=171875 RepID=UPI0035DF44AF
MCQDLRFDGRKRLHYRPISVETGVIPQANGSARIRLGAADVIASVKAELGRPSPLQPGKGKVAIFVECSHTAARLREEEVRSCQVSYQEHFRDVCWVARVEQVFARCSGCPHICKQVYFCKLFLD